jgi:RHS repeat-associated protein
LGGLIANGGIYEKKWSYYYPFGLEQAGISSKALAFGGPENKYKYNGIEKENDFEIGIYDAQLRELDGQTGRWWQIDPKTENMEMWSPYVSNYDSPIKYSDPLGDEGQECCWFTFDKEAFLDGIQWINDNLNPLTPVVELVTGKSSESHFTEPKSRLETLREVQQSMIPGMPVGGRILTKSERLLQNGAKGAKFEKELVKEVMKTEKNVVEQVSIKAKNGAKTKMDVVSKVDDTENAAIVLREAKSSQTAPLRKNQKSAHASIEKDGGVVVGDGKPGVPGGTVIPPTKVIVVRPEDLKTKH